MEGVWKVYGGCREGAWRVSGRCMEAVWKVHADRVSARCKRKLPTLSTRPKQPCGSDMEGLACDSQHFYDMKV